MKNVGNGWFVGQQKLRWPVGWLVDTCTAILYMCASRLVDWYVQASTAILVSIGSIL